MPISAHKNFALTTMASPPSGVGGTSLTVATATGTRFPSVPFNATLWPTGVQPTVLNAEVVRVTAIAADVFTVTRAQEGSSARTHAANDQIAATITARTLTDVEYGAHGWFNVKDPAYGAMGDGVTNDSAAVQAAIDAAPDRATIVFPPGGNYLLSSATPTITGRTDLTFVAHGAKITLSGADRKALHLSGTNVRIRWFGGLIVGSGVLADDHEAIGTPLSPPGGTITTDLCVSDLVIQDVVRGVFINVSTLGDATAIRYVNITCTNMVGTASGKGYGLTMSGVWGGEMHNCAVNAANRHAFYVSVCRGVTLSNLRAKGHVASACLVIARSSDVQGTNVFIESSGGEPVSILPHETDVAADTGRIALRNVSCFDTAAGFSDVMIGGGDPANSSVLYNVLVDGVNIRRKSTDTTDGTQAILIRNGKSITVRNVMYSAPAALTVTKTVVYLNAEGGATYTDGVTVAGIRAQLLSLGAGGFGIGVLVGTNLCSGGQRLTFRDNELIVSGGSGGQAVYYNAARTNTHIEARFNRVGKQQTGSAVLVAGTVTVSTAEILTGDLVQLSRLAAGGTLGHLSLGTITNVTSFVINSSNAADTSTVLWEIVH